MTDSLNLAVDSSREAIETGNLRQKDQSVNGTANGYEYIDGSVSGLAGRT